MQGQQETKTTEETHGTDFGIYMKSSAISQSFKDLVFLIPQDARNAIIKTTSGTHYKHIESKLTAEGNYSYKPFAKNKCIFIHIPKTGGVSVSNTLFGNLAGGHDSAKHYQSAFSKRDYESMFKFTFVRNPWDRLYSAYMFLTAGGMNLRDKAWAKKNLTGFRNFNDFVINGIGKGMRLDYIHFLPQINFLTLPYSQRLQVNFIGLYENLNSDFKTICKRAGLPEMQLAHLNKTKTKRKTSYIHAYDDKCREIVEDFYKKDIYAFGYDFEGRNVENIIAERKNDYYLEKEI